jgi:hypothetical protein
LEEYRAVRAADPATAYNDVALVQDLWPASETSAGEAASTAGPDNPINQTTNDDELTARNAKNAEDGSLN